MLSCEGVQRYKLRRPCHRRQDEATEVVEDGARDDLAERSWITAVGTIQGFEVAISKALLNDRGRVTKANQQKVHEQTTDSTVAVNEGVDAFESGMPRSDSLRGWWRIAREDDAAIDPDSNQPKVPPGRGSL